MVKPATDAEIETFKIHAQSHDRAKFYGHEMLSVLARLDAANARADDLTSKLATAREALSALLNGVTQHGMMRDHGPELRAQARAALALIDQTETSDE